MGSGKMDLLDEVDGKELNYRLTFFTPRKSTSEVSFLFEDRDGTTNTKWTMSGSLPFFLFWMKSMMVAAISMDYDRGLLMIKDHLELGSVPSNLEFPGFDAFAACDYIGVTRTCTIREISNCVSADAE